MTDDELSKLLADATAGPWHSEAERGPINAWSQKASVGIWSQFLFDAALASDEECVDAEDEAWVAGIWGGLQPPAEANARLIAAAPTLAAEVLALRAEREDMKRNALDERARVHQAAEADIEHYRRKWVEECTRADVAEAALSEARAEGMRAAAAIAHEVTALPDRHNAKDYWRSQIGTEISSAILAASGGDA